MKKKILLIIAIVAAGYSAFAQFTAGNLAVYRYGDGSPLVNGGRVPVFIDEYNPTTGEKVRTINISRTPSGANYGLEGLGLTGGGAYEAEGYPVLSRNGETLSIIGYNPAQTGQFVIATIDVSGEVNSSTLVTDNIGAPRSAVVEGNAVYFGGYQNGVRYKLLGTTGASTRVSAENQQNAPRVLNISEFIYNDGNTRNVRLSAPIGGGGTINNAFPLPTAQTTFTGGPPFQSSGLPVGSHQMLVLNAYNRSLLYLLDDNGGNPVIRKYRLNNSATNWLTLGSVSVAAGTKSLSGSFNTTGVTLYFTTAGTPGTQNSHLFMLHDAFTSANQDSKQLSGTPVMIATAPENTAFRGVTMAPIDAEAPTLLTAEVITLSEVKLTWKDNSTTETGFEIEKSVDGVNFSLLTTVAPNTITYTDNAVVAGTTYYYRVRGIESDGPTAYSNTASVTAGSGIITGLNFNGQTVYENQPVGTVAGEFSVVPVGSPNITYTLVAGTGDTDNAKFKISGNQLQTNAVLDFEAQSTYQVRVRATSASNYTYEDTFTITINDVNEAPTITAIGNQNTCIGTEEKTISISGITAGPESGQTVTASITSDNPLLFETLSVNLQAGGNGVITYKLNSANPGTASISLTLKDDGGIANGGVDTHTETFTLNINEFPTANITSDKGNTVDKGIVVKLTASGGATYQWESAEGIIGATNTAELTVRPSQTTTYSVTVTNSGGCSSAAQFTLTVNANYDLVVASNLLSPNGDGINDYWKVENIDLYPDNEVKVFDKSGRIIFNKKGYKNDWDGRIAGSPLNEDTYYYLIDFGPGQPKKKGFIIMLNN